jgi:hypothetical protein
MVGIQTRQGIKPKIVPALASFQAWLAFNVEIVDVCDTIEVWLGLVW